MTANAALQRQTRRGIKQLQKAKQGQAAAGAQMQLAGKHFADFLLTLGSLLLLFFSPLGFKFCCIVLRMANARALIIDRWKLCNLQLGLVICNLRNGLQLYLIWMNAHCAQLSESQLQFLVHFLSSYFLSVTVGSWNSTAKPQLGGELSLLNLG